jgi:hypothetical protein
MYLAIDAIRTDLSSRGLWCGEATLESFGITRRGRQQTCWAGVTSALRASGYHLDRNVFYDEHPPSLSRFIAERPEGDYVLFTADHIMSLRNGRLTDTDLKMGGLRRVRMAYRITRIEAV